MIRWCIHMASNEKVTPHLRMKGLPGRSLGHVALLSGSQYWFAFISVFSFPSPLLVPNICYLGLLVVFCLLGFFVCLFVF